MAAPLLDFRAAQTLPQLWDQLYKQNVPEHTCLQVQDYDTPQTLSYRELNARIQCLGAYLLRQGIRKGDRVLILSDNQAVYLAYDLATQAVGGINVTLSRQFASAALHRILAETTPKFVLMASLAAYRQHQTFLDSWADRTELICNTDRLDELRETDRTTTLQSAIELGKSYWRENPEKLIEAREAVLPQDTATILYNPRPATSKGVVLTHANLLAAMTSLADALPRNITRENSVLSALSPAFIFQRLAGTYLPLALGMGVVHLQALRNLQVALKTFRPTYLLVTPTLLDALIRQMKQQTRGGAKAFDKKWALAAKVQHLQLTGKQPGLLQGLSYKQAISGLFRPLGNKYLPGVKRLICYGEGLRGDVEHCFVAMGVPVVAGFGLPETTGVMSLSDLEAPKLGALGKPLREVHLNDLVNGGRLEVSGPMLSPGYWQGDQQGTLFKTGLRAKTYNGLLYLEPDTAR